MTSIEREDRWRTANRAYLEAELERLRLLCRRRVRWLRRLWEHDPLAQSRSLVISEEQANRLLDGSDWEREARFFEEDAECVAIGQSLDRLEAELAGPPPRPSEPDGLPSLEILAHSFGLTTFERDVLMWCMAADLDPSFSTLFAYMNDDVQARYLTLHLALTLPRWRLEERDAARNMLLPGAPLRRFSLIKCSDGMPAMPQCLRPLHVDARVSDYIRGLNRLDESLARLARPVPLAPVAGAQLQLVEGLVRWANSHPAGNPWPLFQFTGAPRIGKQAVAREFCGRAGLQLCALEANRLPPLLDPERQVLLQLVERETVLSRVAFYLDLGDISSTDTTLMTATRDWLERVGGVWFIGTRERWQFQRPTLHVAVSKPDLATQRKLWACSLQTVPHAVNGEIEDLVQQFDLGPQAIPQVVHAALSRARQRPSGEKKLAAADLWEACREHVGWRLEDLARRIEPCYSWEDIVLPEDALRQLREIANQVATRPQVYEQWGFGVRLPRGRGISALFSGPSGTGKTMAAEILAKHLHLDLYRIDLAGVVSKYIGETEKNLRNVFDAAEQSGAILFFDEADALFGKRSEVKDSHDRYANIEVNYLLQRMEDYRGLAILCTNRRSALDRAFLRRLRFLVEFPFPDGTQRREIWRRVFPPEAPLGDLDLDSLSRFEISGGNIRNIALNAAFLAAGGATTIQMEHLLHAARREYAKIDKLVTELEFGSVRGRESAGNRY